MKIPSEGRSLVLRRILKESLIVIGGTLLLLLLCATVGISTSTPPTSPTAEAAQANDGVTEDPDLDRYPSRRIEDAVTLPLVE